MFAAPDLQDEYLYPTGIESDDLINDEVERAVMVHLIADAAWKISHHTGIDFVGFAVMHLKVFCNPEDGRWTWYATTKEGLDSFPDQPEDDEWFDWLEAYEATEEDRIARARYVEAGTKTPKPTAADLAL